MSRPEPALDAASLSYWVVDVFADRAFAGNPLAVVLDGDELSTAQMQSLALEFNLSETVFPLRPTVPGADYRLRIFTPAAELPFAGHPSVGNAWLLRHLGRVGTGRVVQECGAGLLPIDIGADVVTLTGGTPTLGAAADLAELCAAVGLDVADVVGDSTTPWAGCGLQWAFLHVRDEALARCRPDLGKLDALSASGPDRAGVAVLAWEPGRAHARVFAGGVGVAEDPATGSAALGLGVWLVATGLVEPDGETAYEISQGTEMRRPSRLSCVVRAENRHAVECRVSGTVQPVAQGRIAVPLAM